MKTLGLLLMAAVSHAETMSMLPPAGNVSLPLEEYNRLMALARTPVKKPEAPPVPYAIGSARIGLRVQGETVSGSVLLEGEVTAKGDRKVPLVSSMTVMEARQAGRDLPLQQEGSAHTAILRGPAPFSITLDAALPLIIETGRAAFTLPVPAAGAARLTLSVPGDQTQVFLNPGLITSRSSSNGTTTVEATLVPGQSASVWWAARLSLPIAPKETRFLSEVKTLISAGEADLTVAALADLTVVQGEPVQFTATIPEGWEVTGVTGPTLESADIRKDAAILRVTDAGARSHQFLIAMVRPATGGKADVPIVSMQGAQRETGEVMVEADGAVELKATESGGLRRMDLKEASVHLRTLSHASPQAAFRYLKRPNETPAAALEWLRFPDSPVLAAVGQQATVTTLVTTEGRTLTEVKLRLRNTSQPFLKVSLPAGASIVSAEVAGEKVKPVLGADGSRVPLLRPGFRPVDSYEISYVFLHAGAPFARKGGAELALPRMDLPIGLVSWEVFLPQQYKIANLDGDALPASLLPGAETGGDPGSLSGTAVDPAGAGVPGAPVTVTHLGTGHAFRTTTDEAGRWIVYGVPPGRVRVQVAKEGFKTALRDTLHDAVAGTSLQVELQVGLVSETVALFGMASKADNDQQRPRVNVRQNAASPDLGATSNVLDLQKRVAGVLPIAVNVPRTGNSYKFVRPLTVDEETKLTFTYKSK